MAKTKFSIEGAFEQLEDIIEQLSSEEISLSDSMDLYKKGVKILDKCSIPLNKTYVFFPFFSSLPAGFPISSLVLTTSRISSSI